MKIIIFFIFVFTKHCFCELKFKSIEQLNPGVTSKKEVLHIFGKAANITFEGEPEKYEVWNYQENGFDKLILSFTQKTGILISFSWSISDGDPEENIDLLFNSQNSAKWTVDNDRWVHAHYLPPDCYFKETTLGLKIHYDSVKKKALYFFRTTPQRILASYRSKTPPKFCWNDKMCSNAMPGEEWERTWSQCTDVLNAYARKSSRK
jgi:hypothetical protein